MRKCTYSPSLSLAGGQVREASLFSFCGFRCLMMSGQSDAWDSLGVWGLTGVESFLWKLINH